VFFDLFKTKVDKIYIYGCSEETETAANCFFSVNDQLLFYNDIIGEETDIDSFEVEDEDERPLNSKLTAIQFV